MKILLTLLVAAAIADSAHADPGCRDGWRDGPEADVLPPRVTLQVERWNGEVVGTFDCRVDHGMYLPVEMRRLINAEEYRIRWTGPHWGRTTSWEGSIHSLSDVVLLDALTGQWNASLGPFNFPGSYEYGEGFGTLDWKSLEGIDLTSASSFLFAVNWCYLRCGEADTYSSHFYPILWTEEVVRADGMSWSVLKASF